MPINDIYEARYEGVTVEGTRWNIVWHWLLNDNEQTNLYDTSLGLATECFNKWTDGDFGLQLMMVEGSSTTSVRANRVYPSIGVPASHGVLTPGGVTTEGMPADIAVVLSKRTSLPGRRFRGRAFLGNVAEGQQANGLLTTASATSFADLAATTFPSALLDPNANGWDSIVFSKTAADAGEPIWWDDIARLEVDTVLRKMTPRGSKVRIPVTPS
jgi:hypothetical protein